MQFIRSTIYFILMVITGAIYGGLAGFTVLIPFDKRFKFISQWARFNIWALKKICGLGYEIRGKENIPDEASIILSKHQSTWETFATQIIFPPQTWVLKKSLLNIPFFGWGLRATEPVAIDRAKKRKAMEQVMEQGKDRLDKGRWIVIFPEGTRIAPGKKGKYKLGGARLAIHSGRKVVPVAHNAGEFWARHSFTKYPGTITISILPPIDPAGLSAEELNKQVENAIESEMKRITTLKNAY
ncbi:MAG: lysophospholipid acyltransferase family protein [Gammaproteobacteria bacterium]|nr:lysophospholipid acyltransferase family protein [Gammaproteobacteria bacterium]